jgi:23S rRNA (guanine1835-N2)-methyltransferase
VTFQARVLDGPSCRFISRPGVFTYGRFDDGARAMVETAVLKPGDRVLDLGCGCGVAGVFASQQTGPEGHIAFVDSNVRAVALTELNARANGVTSFQAVASSTVAGVEGGPFDVALANPPYIADHSVARLFIERARELLKPRGRFYLVTKQPEAVAQMVADVFGAVDGVPRRGYTVLVA